MPHRDAIFICLGIGCLLGLLLSSADFTEVCARKRLNLSQEFSVEYVCLLLVTVVAVVALYVLLLDTFGPDFSARAELYGSSADEIGEGFSIALIMVGMVAVWYPAKALIFRFVEPNNNDQQSD